MCKSYLSFSCRIKWICGPPCASALPLLELFYYCLASAVILFVLQSFLKVSLHIHSEGPSPYKEFKVKWAKKKNLISLLYKWGTKLQKNRSFVQIIQWTYRWSNKWLLMCKVQCLESVLVCYYWGVFLYIQVLILCCHPADMKDWYQMIAKAKQPKMRLAIGHLQVRTSQHLLYILKTVYHILLLLQNETSY